MEVAGAGAGAHAPMVTIENDIHKKKDEKKKLEENIDDIK